MKWLIALVLFVAAFGVVYFEKKNLLLAAFLAGIVAVVPLFADNIPENNKMESIPIEIEKEAEGDYKPRTGTDGGSEPAVTSGGKEKQKLEENQNGKAEMEPKEETEREGSVVVADATIEAIKWNNDITGKTQIEGRQLKEGQSGYLRIGEVK